MKHKEHYREKDGGIQAIVSYKYDDSTQWKTKSKQGFKKISDAKRWASSMIVELADGEGRQLMDENMTLGDAVELFLASKSYLTYNSQLAYKNALKQFTPYFNTKLSALNAVKTQSIAALVSSGHHRNVKIFWNYLEEMDLIKKNYLVFPKKEKSNRDRLVTPEEYRVILNSNIDSQIKICCLVAYHTGMRIGEILGLTPDCVKHNKIIVNKQWANIGKNIQGFKELKNKEKGIREIPISSEVYHSIQSLPFNFRDGRYFQINCPTLVNKKLKQLGLKHSIHDFRHTRASEMVHAGFNIKYIAYILGDRIETVIKTYVSINQKMIDEETERFLAHI